MTDGVANPFNPEFVKNVVLSSDFKEGMNALINYCRDISPGPVWDKIRDLDYEKEMNSLRTWLKMLLKTELPADEINALYFGIFSPIVDRKESLDFYLCGSTRYDPDDETCDWACWDDDTYLPDGRDANSQILRNIFQLLHSYKAYNTGYYVLPLGYTGLVVKSICRSLDKSLLGGRNHRAVAVGYDEGDFIVIGEFGKKI